MAEVNNFVLTSNDLFLVTGRNYSDDGLADDDSWVENNSQGGDDLNDFDSFSEPSFDTDREELGGYNSNAIDFTLHTIVEESCEDSEFESNDGGVNKLKGNNPTENTHISPSDLERYFFFGLGDGDRNNTLEDSSSEIFSDCSDNLDTTGSNEVYLSDTKSAFDLSTSRLEKYFLSGFMGFTTENKSDGSVGSDSEGQPSPNQRKKKLVRARGTPRSNNSSLDNLVDSVDFSAKKSNESLDSSESEDGSLSETAIICDNIDPVRRKKNYRKRESLDSKPFTELNKNLNSPKVPNTDGESSVGIDQEAKHNSQIIKASEGKPVNSLSIPPSTKTSLVRKDSFNNWSSDEETNLMMSKMRQFFKTLIAVAAQNYTQSNSFGSNSERTLQERTAQQKTKTFQFLYLEKELTRLMKTVPSINNQQVREIVEYLSSEDTWSDSNDSSDCNEFRTDVDLQKPKANELLECSNITYGPPDGAPPCTISKQAVFLYKNLIESLLTTNSNINSEVIDIEEKGTNRIYTEKPPQFLANVMQHIGSKLVALMHDVNIGNETNVPVDVELQKVDVVVPEDNSTKIVLDHLDASPSVSTHWGILPRSKSHDILFGSTNRSWHYNSGNAVNDTGETSDCDRFSWRGSFESALLAPGYSRSKLLTVDRDNGSNTSEASILKRASVDNLAHNIIQNNEQLDRVRSCGSIGVVSEQSSSETTKLWLSTSSDFQNKTNLQTSSTSIITDNLVSTNSLPRLQSLEFPPNISDKAQSDSNVIQSKAKSARYRSPAIQTNIFSSLSKSKNRVQISGAYALHNVPRTMKYSTSLDDFSISEFSSNMSISPGLQRNQFYKRNTANFGVRSDSLTSVNSDAFDNRYGNVKVRGQVEFAMQYNYKISALEVHIVKCKDLASVDTKRCLSDPYVKVYLLPDKSKSGKRKTKVKKRTLNPVFDEVIRFYVSISNLETRSIWLTVWHSDMFGHNDFLGEVTVDLQGKVFDNPQSQWYMLQEKNKKPESVSTFGDIVVGLKFTSLDNCQVAASDCSTVKAGVTRSSCKGQLQVLIKEAKNLHSVKASGTCDAFCKSYLLPNRTRSSKQKTPICKKSLNPVWNYTYVYDDVTLDELSERALELTVWDHDRLISNQFLGGVRFSLGTGMHSGQKVAWMDSKGKELCLWQEMMNRPNFWVEGSVSLRNLNIKREEKCES